MGWWCWCDGCVVLLYGRDPTRSALSATAKHKAATVSMTSDAAQSDDCDLAAIIQISQAMSAETSVGNLVDRFMRAAVEQSGALRAVLVAIREEEFRTSAEAILERDEI